MIQKLYFKFQKIYRELKNRYPRTMIMPRYLIRILHWWIHPRPLRTVADNRLSYAYDPSADIFLLSFPKCGRTWLRLMIGKSLSLQYNLNNVTNFDILKVSTLHKMHPKIPKISICHDDVPHNKSPEELERNKTRYKGKKVILLIRQPGDAIVSLYFDSSKRKMTFDGNISSLIQLKKGGLESFIRYYNIWKENRHIPSDFLLVRYEDMKANTERELRRVMDFICPHVITNEIINKAVKYGGFDNMRKLEEAGKLGKKSLRKTGDYETYKTRRGKVGGYVDYLKESDMKYLRKIVSRLSSFYGYSIVG